MTECFYVLLDEIQLVPEFEDFLNSYLHIWFPMRYLNFNKDEY